MLTSYIGQQIFLFQYFLLYKKLFPSCDYLTQKQPPWESSEILFQSSSTLSTLKVNAIIDFNRIISFCKSNSVLYLNQISKLCLFFCRFSCNGIICEPWRNWSYAEENGPIASRLWSLHHRVYFLHQKPGFFFFFNLGAINSLTLFDCKVYFFDNFSIWVFCS